MSSEARGGPRVVTHQNIYTRGCGTKLVVIMEIVRIPRMEKEEYDALITE